MGQGFFFGQNFARDPCPICGLPFSRCGLPNHIRRHQLAAQRSKQKTTERKSAAWWEGWKEGYKAGLRDVSNHPDRQSWSQRSRQLPFAARSNAMHHAATESWRNCCHLLDEKLWRSVSQQL